jgi:hypothetical protein
VSPTIPIGPSPKDYLARLLWQVRQFACCIGPIPAGTAFSVALRTGLRRLHNEHRGHSEEFFDVRL